MESITVREYEQFELPEAQGLPLLKLLQEIWNNRKTNPTYFSNEETSTNQRFFEVQHLKGCIRFKATQYMGVFQTSDVRIQVIPKIFNEQTDNMYQKLLWMISYAENIATPVSPDIELEATSNDSMYQELLIWLFARKCHSVLQKKSYMHYDNRQENIGFVKGKILFSEHLKHNIAHNRQDKVYCEYDLYQEDNLFNQILKFVIESLLRTTSLPMNKRWLEKCLDPLHDVSRRKCTYSDTLKIRLNPFQKDFEPLLRYCQFFLNQQKPFWTENSFQLDYVVFNMNKLYEKFLASFLRKHFSNEWLFKASASHNFLTTDQQFNLEFDFHLKEINGAGRVIIGDAKYKTGIDLSRNGTESGISSGDFYQLLTYAIREKADAMILIYPEESDSSVVSKEFFIRDEYGNNLIPFHAIKVPIKGSTFHEMDYNLKVVLDGYFNQEDLEEKVR